MNDSTLYTFLAVSVISIISFVGIVVLAVKHKLVAAASSFLVSFAVGALLGDAFIHILPEAWEMGTNDLDVPLSVIGGILVFFLLEKYVRWHHKHYPFHNEEEHPAAIMNVIGDGVHNFIDGIIIASSFMASPAVGLSTALAVVIHEIPQEISDFAVLIHSGWNAKKALFFNFLSALTAFLGAALTLILGQQILGDRFLTYSLPFTAGGFIYIAASDLIPDLHEKVDIKSSLLQIIFILLGIVVMTALLILE